LPYEERKIAVAPGGGEVWALAIDTEDALLDYLEMFYKLRRAGSALKKMGAVDFATTIAPGLRDVLLTGKACEVVKRKEKKQDNAYDYVILDAPPTGRITRFLNVNGEVSGLAKVGPIKTHADSVMSVIASEQTAVHVVTLLEEMPVQETLDGVNELATAGLPVGGIFVNMTRPPQLDSQQRSMAIAGELPKLEIESEISQSGLTPTTQLIAALITEASDHAERVELEETELERLISRGLPIFVLPLLPSGIDLGALYELAAIMSDSGIGGE
jgi:anion-transporting  ArsA/GET3 family ATPase